MDEIGFRPPGAGTGKSRHAARGFTLVELLVVVAIIGMLVALLLPAIQAVRESARRSACSNNLRQIGLGLQNYVSARKSFPPGVQQTCYKCEPWSWSALILSYMEEANIADLLEFRNQPTHIPNANAKFTGPTQKVIPIFLCPSTAHIDVSRGPDFRIADYNNNNKWDPGEGLGVSDYGGIQGPSSSVINPITTQPYGYNRGVLLNIGDAEKTLPGVHVAPAISPKKISDGLSKTMIVAELTGRGFNSTKNELRGTWAHGYSTFAVKAQINMPESIAWVSDEIFSDHQAGANVAFCDGSVHFLDAELDLLVLCAISSRDGGEQIPKDVAN